MQEAVKLKPSFADAHLNQGNVYKVSLMNYDSSLWPGKLSQLVMEQMFWLVQAMGMLQEAIACYQRALQARPDYAMAYGTQSCFIICVQGCMVGLVCVQQLPC